MNIEPTPTVNLGPLLIGYLVAIIITAGIGFLIGRRKERPVLGAVLGGVLGLIGILVIALLSPKHSPLGRRTPAEIAAAHGLGVKPISTEIGSMTLTTQLRIQVPTRSGAVLMLSDSRRFWWDGRRWWDGHSVTPPEADRSPDGLTWWDGEQWRPVVKPGAH